MICGRGRVALRWLILPHWLLRRLLAGLLLLIGVGQFGLLFIAITVHEFAHGWMAYKLGDSTASLSGRLTLNPLAHIDPFWTILLPLVLFLSTAGHFVFGAAKPVPINYWSLKNPKRDMIWIGLAGPLANFILAFIIAGILVRPANCAAR